ncbi:hypothetical protein [Nocardia sp. NPDC003963]
MSRQVEYLCQTAGGTVIYVSSEGNYDSFRLWRGDGRAMREERIVNVERLRDGGTTFIETETGVFWSPSPLQRGTPPCWVDPDDLPSIWDGQSAREEQNLTKLNPADFDITDTGDEAVVVRRNQ